MSILDRMMKEANGLGINVHEPVDEQGMAYVLTKADNFGLLNYKPGMAPDWLDAGRLYCHEHGRSEFTFMEMLAAVLQMSVDAEQGFQMPRKFFTAVQAYGRRQIRRALNGRQAPPIPNELQGVTVDEERAYVKQWFHHAKRTGDGAEATRAAMDAYGITPGIHAVEAHDVEALTRDVFKSA